MSKKKALIITGSIVFLIGAFAFGVYWINTQPVWIVRRTVADSVKNLLPDTNRKIIDFIESKGDSLAPVYREVVCTEFVIRSIEPFQRLTREEKQKIRIITTDELVPLVKKENDITKGVQNALVSSGKGTAIIRADEVKPGDFVQFWSITGGKAYGHCGIVSSISPNETITVYSSHPLTNGYGIQKFIWPDYAYFVRLKPE